MLLLLLLLMMMVEEKLWQQPQRSEPSIAMIISITIAVIIIWRVATAAASSSSSSATEVCINRNWVHNAGVGKNVAGAFLGLVFFINIATTANPPPTRGKENKNESNKEGKVALTWPRIEASLYGCCSCSYCCWWCGSQATYLFNCIYSLTN